MGNTFPVDDWTGEGKANGVAGGKFPGSFMNRSELGFSSRTVTIQTETASNLMLTMYLHRHCEERSDAANQVGVGVCAGVRSPP
jgi:hypothetical protein